MNLDATFLIADRPILNPIQIEFVSRGFNHIRMSRALADDAFYGSRDVIDVVPVVFSLIFSILIAVNRSQLTS